MSSSDRVPDHVDMAVGETIRAIRRKQGVSQADLASALGLTFQQVQKYERGLNRISASKLWHAATILGVPVGKFFGERPTLGSAEDLSEILADPETRSLLDLWLALPRMDQRDAVLSVLRVLVPSEPMHHA